MHKFLIVFILLIATPVLADTLSAPSNSTHVLVFETKDKMEYFIKECAGKGNRSYERDCIACIKKMVPSGARCSVVSKTFTARKIRIMTGEFVGVVGWVPMEMVLP